MDVEILEVCDFLAGHRPFDALPHEARSALARKVQVQYARRRTEIVQAGAYNRFVYMIRSGAVEVSEGGAEFVARLGEGDYFAYPSLLRDGIARNSVTAIEDSLLYLIDADSFARLCERHARVRGYFATAEADRLREAVQDFRQHHLEPHHAQLIAVRVGDLVRRRRVVATGPATPVGEAARTMRDEDVSTMLVIDNGRLDGILTDKDLRRRVIAGGLDHATPIATVMTRAPITLAAAARAFDALLEMTRRNIHHLPVTDADGTVIGMVSANDVLGRISANALYLTARIAKAAARSEIVAAVAGLPGSLASLVDAGASADDIGRFVSSVGEAAHRRLAELAEAELGPPPIPYALVVFGSLARGEQTALSDQDNGLVLDDAYDEAAHGAYFKALATSVSDGLDAAGYVYCGGDIMATNPRWRRPLAGWQATFEQWIAAPEPKAVMHTSIFYDLRAVHGDASLVARLQAAVLERAGANSIFLAHMAQNALMSHPPLGFFRKLVLLKDKDHRDTLDLKGQGVMPIVDVARVVALEHGLVEINTRERLLAAERAGALAAGDAADLRDALEFVAQVRLRHQARQIKADRAPDNYVAPGELSRFERDHLKDAFAVVRRAQEAVSNRYMGGLL